MVSLSPSLGHQVHWLMDNLKTSDSPAYSQVSKHLHTEMKETVDDLPKFGANLSKLLDHIKVILVNLHSAHHSMPSMYVAFKRAGSAYKADQAYRGFQFSSKNVRRVTSFLSECGYVELAVGYPGLLNYDPQLSKMRATPKLIDLLSRFNADPATIYRDTRHEESVILKGKKVLPPKRLWKDGKRPKPKRKIIQTPDTRVVRQMRANLQIINKVIQSSSIDLDMDLHELDELNRKLAADPDKYKRPVDFTDRNATRRPGFWSSI